jgi:hypothetical protein
MRGMNLAVGVLCMGTIIVAVLIPRIPPFLGYFLCRLSHDFEILGDPCQLDSELDIHSSLVSFRFNEIKTQFGILSGCACFVIYVSGAFNGNLMPTYEVLPNLIFQKDCLAQFQEAIAIAKFSDFKKTMGKYKQLQLLNIMFNEIYGRDFFGIIMACILLIIIPTGFFLLTSYHINPIVLIVLLFMTFMEYLVATTIFIMASKVWNASAKFRYGWRKNTRLSSRPLSRKYGSSLQNMKIMIGSSNFIEKNTPFIFLSLCIEQTITLVLLKNV